MKNESRHDAQTPTGETVEQTISRDGWRERVIGLTPDQAVQRVRDGIAFDRIAGDWETELATQQNYVDAVAYCEEMIFVARQRLRELRALRTHRCEFDSEDYCAVCGCDGRA